MASRPEKSSGAKGPSRAASLQRMLEMERKQKMERMQQQQAPPPAGATGRRGVSPASASSSSSSKHGILHRRRESSVPRQDEQRPSATRNFTLPPLAIHTQPAPRISLSQERASRPAEANNNSSSNNSNNNNKPPREARRPDRDALPSMVKAATAHDPSSNLKIVSFANEDGDQSDDSSICHSPTWDDYGKKKRKPTEEKRKRLSKHPPPAAMENRPVINSRAMSDTVLSNQQTRQSVEKARAFQLSSSTPTGSPSLPAAAQWNSVESVETVVRSPAFIGGVRLERERDAAMKRLMNVRAASAERPSSEVLSPTSEHKMMTDALKKRETAPALSYPPASSKTPFLKQAGNTRPRRGSFGNGIISAAGKLFGSKDKDHKGDGSFAKRNGSQESVQTVQTLSLPQDRGRQMNGVSMAHTRGTSYDSHQRYAGQKGEKRGAISLPPVSWKNLRKNRTTSMIAVPPDSARDGSFSIDRSPVVGEDNFGFLERPFSPPVDGPLSPPASLSASMKAKMSPKQSPKSTASNSPAWQPGKKKLKDAIRTGFRSSPETPETTPLKRRRSGTMDTLVGTDTELHPPVAGAAAKGSPALSSKGARRSAEHRMTGALGRPQQATAGPKDSGASSSSSHPDSESQPPSPATTPDTSRPQSSKDNQGFRTEDSRRAAAAQQQGFGYFLPRRSESPRIEVEIPTVSRDEFLGARPRGRSGSNFIEDLPSQQLLPDEGPWGGRGRRPPLDADQMSFTSALTSIDVKRSFNDLDSVVDTPLQSPNGDVTPLSLERDAIDPANALKMTVSKVELEVKQAPGAAGFRSPRGQNFNLGAPDTSFLPALPHQALPIRPGRPGQRLILTDDLDQRSPLSSLQRQAGNPDFLAPPSSKASNYLHEARKVAPSSPRSPTTTTKVSNIISSSGSGNSSSNSINTTAVSGPRSFALLPNPAASAAKAAAAVTSAHPESSTTTTTTQDASASTEGGIGGGKLDKPIAKMLVECCHCKFYQDMPSRVYEAMARPDDVVKDKRLGVSGQVTTCVKCPWCSHNMSTVCCAGYAAVVYLREKLHGP